MNSKILRWIEMVENGEIKACEEQHLLVKLVRHCFETEDIYTDEEQLENYLGLADYFPFDRLFEWQEFCTALHLCTYWKETGLPRWPNLFLLIGRGAGKDGFIAFESKCLVSPYNPIKYYDVDICATAEDVAMRPVNDILEAFEEHEAKMRKFFYWNKTEIRGLKNRGTIKGRTSNPKSKDGMRSGMVVFNEVHQYEDYKNIKVFVTSLGKKAHPRRLYATTNGDVRDGPIDDYIARSESILRGEVHDKGFLPFICKLNSKEDVHDKTKWVMANPSLPYFPHLMQELEHEYEEWLENPVASADFMTKRMNLPQSDSEIVVIDWDNILATNKELPDLSGESCVVGIDYASISDWTSVNLHFQKDGLRYDINHSWLCLNSKDLHRLKVPWREWAEQGLITLVDDVEIHPDLICRWISKKAQLYNITKIAIDNFRYALFSKSLKEIGFDASERKNVKLVRPSDIMKVQPVVESAFNNQSFIWGDNPALRWGANNTKLVRNNTGNTYYAKIEPKSRKTDPFMALVHSMTIEEEIKTSAISDVPVIIG